MHGTIEDTYDIENWKGHMHNFLPIKASRQLILLLTPLRSAQFPHCFLTPSTTPAPAALLLGRRLCNLGRLATLGDSQVLDFNGSETVLKVFL